jgi:pseudouridylate synthase
MNLPERAYNVRAHPCGRPHEFTMKINPIIAAALAAGEPVVALESTIISHGMPFPRNVATALRVEQTVRDNGALPATIAVIKGELVVGLTEAEITFLGQEGSRVIKASRRDLPYLVATKQTGATTVAATMIIAQMAGIQVFATGGIGGVHRGAAETMDISADLQELAQTNVAVVCAGVKSILDIGLTLEYLETQGVPVLGFKTNDFPAFYTQKSGFSVDYRLDTPQEIADLLYAKWQMNLQGGAIIGNPIPDAFAMDFELINTAINAALAEADAQHIVGKNVTPFLLARIAELTKGSSLDSNIELVCNNAFLATQIAVALSKIG